MDSFKKKLNAIVAAAFESAGVDPKYGVVETSKRKDLADYQCNGALPAQKEVGKKGREIAEMVIAQLNGESIFSEIGVAGPGFINLRIANEFIAAEVSGMATDETGRFGMAPAAEQMSIIVDYGGANVAKPLHIGHLRAAIIGESLKRLSRFLGHDTVGDVHLGDWGLQMGQIIAELEERRPDLPYFVADADGPFPAESPVSIDDLAEIYPAGSAKSKADLDWRAKAQKATVDLQNGRPGYVALWQHFVDVSVDDLKKNYGLLDVNFDLWLGESDAHPYIETMVAQMKADGHAVESNGALVIHVEEETDKGDIPPLMLITSNDAVGYGTTDLATIVQRVTDYDPDLVLYVVDNRQQLHFKQVFRSAYKTGIADIEKVGLEHNHFGTMNGKDGKPFKTRSGGVLRLEDMVSMVIDKAYERMAEIGAAEGYSEEEKGEIARQVGISALKFADLINHRTGDYVFDLDRFSSFEGRTGPYLLYAVVRIKSILRKAADAGLAPGTIVAAAGDAERDTHLKLLELPELIQYTFDTRAPNHLAEYAYQLATEFNRFYAQSHILNEPDPARQASWLGLVQLVEGVLTLSLDLLGISVPERM